MYGSRETVARCAVEFRPVVRRDRAIVNIHHATQQHRTLLTCKPTTPVGRVEIDINGSLMGDSLSQHVKE